MADTLKCPSCGGNLLFDPDSQKLACEFCGSAFAPSEIEVEVEELEHDGSSYEEQFSLPDEDKESVDHSEDVMEFVCNSCGASVVADKLQSATFCAFCGSPAIVGQKLSKEFKPKYILPFAISRDRAKQSLINWCKGGRMAPFGFVSDKNIEKLTGLYVPYWLYGVDAHMDRKASYSTSDSVRVGDKITTTTRYFTAIRKADFSWKNIPLDGASKIDDKYMEAIEPFDFTKLVPYDYKYIPGFYADIYDLDDKDLEKRAIDRAKTYLDEEFTKSLNVKNSSITERNDKYGVSSAEYALLPVWFMNYQYLGKTYTFTMNGQTGEIAGIQPISMVKRFLIFMVALAIFTIITKIIAGIILGGYVG